MLVEQIVKIRAEKNGSETQKTTEKVNETKSQIFEKINKSLAIDLARLINKKRRAQINKIRNEKGDVTTDTTEYKGTKDYYKQLYANTTDNLEERDKILRKVQSSKTELGRNRNSKQTNSKY